MNNYQLVKNTEWKEVEINGEDKDIPLFWKLSAIKNIAQEKKKRRITKENDNFCINLEDISQGDGKIISSSTWKENKSIKTIFEKNDILYGKLRPYLKKYWVADKEGLCSTEIIVLSNTQETIPLYLYSLIIEEKFNSYINEKAEGTRMPRARWEDIKSFQLALPPLEQQSAIASILSSQESIIQDIESLISKYESRFQYLSEELLSGRLRVKEVGGQTIFYKNADDNWKEVEINGEMKEIPHDWDLDTIGGINIPLIKTGVKLYSGKLPFYATGEVEDFNLSLQPTGFFSYDTKPSRANLAVYDNSIYMARMKNTLKILNFAKKQDILLSTGFLGLRPNPIFIDRNFLYNLIQTSSFQERKNQNCKGSTQESLSDSAAQSIQIIIPLLEEQILIGLLLKDVTALIDQQKEFLTKERQKFDWLLDNLLSGKYLVK